MVVQSAQPPLAFVPPQYNPWVMRFVKLGIPPWLRLTLGIERVELHNAAPLVNLYREFQTGKARFIIAFRHPSTDDPPCLHQLLLNIVPREARQLGTPLLSQSHAHFLYERGILLWLGGAGNWLLPRLGATPILRGKVDRAGLRQVRELLTDGQFPFAAAPEGGVNGHTEQVSPLEPGVVQMGYWCADDLHKAGRAEQVYIVPIGVKYTYPRPPWQSLHLMLCEVEAACGVPVHTQPLPTDDGDRPAFFRHRLLVLRDYLLPLLEHHYRSFYSSSISGDGTIQDRLQTLLDAAFGVAEQTLAVSPKGTLTERRHTLEQAAWDRIYRADIDVSALLPVEQGIADQLARESSLLLWHMRLVENFVGVTGDYIARKPSFERIAETALLIRDLVSRMQGVWPPQRPILGPRLASFTVGDPLSVTDRWPSYKDNRRAAVAELTEVLQTALEDMVV